MGRVTRPFSLLMGNNALSFHDGATNKTNVPRTLSLTTRCIAKREGLLFTAEREGVACSRNFLSESRTNVEESDVVALLRVLDQVWVLSCRRFDVALLLAHFSTFGQKHRAMVFALRVLFC